jgi:hypothetical protein
MERMRREVRKEGMEMRRGKNGREEGGKEGKIYDREICEDYDRLIVPYERCVLYVQYVRTYVPWDDRTQVR